MAEHFNGKYRSLHTSNGGAEIFLKGLVCSCRLLKPSELNVVTFLKAQLLKENGNRSFDLYPLPEELAQTDDQLFFLKVLKLFIKRILSKQLDKELEQDYYNRELQLKWAGFAYEFYNLITESITHPFPEIQLKSGSEKELIQLHRLYYRLADFKKRDNKKEQLKTINEIILIKLKIKEMDLIWMDYSEQAELLLIDNHTNQAINALYQASKFADGEEKQALIDYAESLDQ